MKLLSLTSRNLKEIYRDPVSTLLGLAMPVALLILFSTIYKSAHVELFSPQKLPPGMVIFSFAILMMFSSILLAKDRQSAFLIRLYTTPLKPSDFILSYMPAFIPLALSQVIVCFIVVLIFRFLASPVDLLIDGHHLHQPRYPDRFCLHTEPGIRNWSHRDHGHQYFQRRLDTLKRNRRRIRVHRLCTALCPCC